MDSPDTTPQQRIVIVIGAGRSGTSTLTRGLEALGVELGDRLKPGSRKNPKGFFEDLDILGINQRVSRAFGLTTTGSDVRLVDESLFRSPEVKELHDEAVDLMRRRFGTFPLWGFKSGGVLRLLPFWSRVFDSLNAAPSYVVALRHPVSVAQSRARLNPLRGRQEKSDLEWLARMVPYFHLVRAHPFVVVDYDLLLSAPADQLNRIAERLMLPLAADAHSRIQQYANEFVTPALRHHASPDRQHLDDVSPLTASAYLNLYLLATDAWTTDSDRFWTEWLEIKDALLRMGPALRHIDFLEGELRSTRWGMSDALRIARRRLQDVWQTASAARPTSTRSTS